MHKVLGHLALLFTFVGGGSAILLASALDSIDSYGGNLSKWGFYSMASCAAGTAAIGFSVHSGRRYEPTTYMDVAFFWLTLGILLALSSGASCPRSVVAKQGSYGFSDRHMVFCSLGDCHC